MNVDEYPGIDLDRWTDLRRRDMAFRLWTDSLMPGTRNGIELRPLNKSLTRWEITRLGVDRWNRVTYSRIDGFLEYTVVLYTPPARPEWLTAIARPA